jgi:hypothetical protein
VERGIGRITSPGEPASSSSRACGVNDVDKMEARSGNSNEARVRGGSNISVRVR